MLKKNNPLQIWAWSMFDFANTSFTIIVSTVIFPLYFKDQICNISSFHIGNIEFQNPSDLFWGIGNSLSFLIVAITAPILGAMSDISSRKKKYIFFYSVLCILSTCSIYFLEPGDILFALILLVLGNIGFETGIIFYDAMLPMIASEDKFSKYSGYGFAMGYVGAILSLTMANMLANINQIKDSFVAASLFFLISSLPFFILIKEEKKTRVANFTAAFKKSVADVAHTILTFNEQPKAQRFIGSFFFYMNGIGTVIAFGGIYASTTLKFTTQQVIIFFLLVQFFAMLGSLIFGYLGQKFGDYKMLKFVIFLWMLVCVLSFASGLVSYGTELFYLVGVMAGMGLGSCQALSRSYFSRLIPAGKESQFFGFYSLCGRFAAILGPLFFGLISSLTGDQSLAVLSILVFFIIGYYLFLKIEKPA